MRKNDEPDIYMERVQDNSNLKAEKSKGNKKKNVKTEVEAKGEEEAEIVSEKKVEVEDIKFSEAKKKLDNVDGSKISIRD